jgi:cell division protein FtsQ
MRRWLLAGTAVLAAVPAGLLARPVLRDIEFFRVRRVEVVGARYLSGDDVLAALQLPGDASLLDPTGPLERRVVAIAGVRSVQVARRWPGTLVVRLEEWEPVGLTPAPEGLALLDARGGVLPFDPTRWPDDLPVASADSLVARVLARLREHVPEFYQTVVAAWRVRGDVVLDTGGPRVWVRGDATVDELHALTAVADDLARKGHSYRELDARYTDRILVRGMKL